MRKISSKKKGHEFKLAIKLKLSKTLKGQFELRIQLQIIYFPISYIWNWPSAASKAWKGSVLKKYLSTAAVLF